MITIPKSDIDKENRRHSLFGVPIDCLSYKEVIRLIEQYIESKKQAQIVTSDSAGIVIAQQDPEFLKIIQQASIVTPDSSGVVWALRRKLKRKVERVSGVDLVEILCELSHKKGYRIYFLGSQPGVADKAAENLKKKYPNCNIVGTHHGYFGSEDDYKVAKEIAVTKPDVLFVAMGMPRQEMFIHQNLEITKAYVAMGVGGSLDVFSGKAKRAPQFVQSLGIEWLWRFIQNPRKLYKIKLLPKYVSMVLRSRD